MIILGEACGTMMMRQGMEWRFSDKAMLPNGPWLHAAMLNSDLWWSGMIWWCVRPRRCFGCQASHRWAGKCSVSAPLSFDSKVFWVAHLSLWLFLFCPICQALKCSSHFIAHVHSWAPRPTADWRWRRAEGAWGAVLLGCVSVRHGILSCANT